MNYPNKDDNNRRLRLLNLVPSLVHYAYISYKYQLSANSMGAILCCQQNYPSGDPKMVSSKSIPSNEVNIKLEDIFKILIETKNKKISLHDFDKVGTIGQGGYGKVYLVYEKTSVQKGQKIPYAMKVIPKRLVYERRLYDQLINQKQILADVKHRFLIDLVYAFQDHKNCYFVMDYAPGGDVYTLLSHLPKHSAKAEAYRTLGQDGARFIMACVILGLQCLHQHNLVYRDLKPQNVLIFSDGYVKLTDFGLSKKVEQGDKTNSLAGTKLYLAPEIVERYGHNRLVDLWALGIFLNQLLGLDEPFEPQWIIRGKFKKACLALERHRNWNDAEISPEAKDLITKLMKVNPESRLGAQSFEDLKKHPFFADIDWQKLVNMEIESPLKDLAQRYPVKSRLIRETNVKDDQADFPTIEGLTYQPSYHLSQTQ